MKKIITTIIITIAMTICLAGCGVTRETYHYEKPTVTGAYNIGDKVIITWSNGMVTNIKK